ncbi:MAG: polysaccharide biosynthesis protein [Synergistaceae bacterium]|nr:polysaccharide biosynthesis protein [Synergistaceae bacterium]
MKEFFWNKKVLLLGGTGTVGECILQKLLSLDVKTVRVFSRDEHKQFAMQNRYQDRRLRFLLGDVRDPDRVLKAAEDIDVIFNLAALKHVPACEYNPYEAVKTNVMGTQNVINAAVSQKVGHVILTSSDKAVSPTNAMGATKLLAERLISSAYYSQGAHKTAFCAVRFGNVMGSRGSVIPLFKEQIINSGKVTITDPSMTRFMMTCDEAAALTMQAATMAKYGEIFVLKMPTLRVGDLAEVVIDLTSEKFNLDRSKVFTEVIGLRPGEKMYEELMTEEESEVAFDLAKMYMIPPQNFYNRYVEADPQIKNAPKGEYRSKDSTLLTKGEIERLLRSYKLVECPALLKK